MKITKLQAKKANTSELASIACEMALKLDILEQAKTDEYGRIRTTKYDKEIKAIQKSLKIADDELSTRQDFN